jgi:hypothetical protein
MILQLIVVKQVMISIIGMMTTKNASGMAQERFIQPMEIEVNREESIACEKACPQVIHIFEMA